MRLKGERVAVCGGGGFIGGHLVKYLRAQGVDVVRAVDVKPLTEWYQTSSDVENLVLDLKDKDSCYQAAKGVKGIFQLAADMGGMGFIENNKALCMLSVLTNTHMLMAARDSGVERFFYSSSACVYNGDKQKNEDVRAFERGGRVSGIAGGRLWMGEALQRADVPPFRGGFRDGVSRGSLSQRLRHFAEPGMADAKRRRRRFAGK